jgi:hypothetical protein
MKKKTLKIFIAITLILLVGVVGVITLLHFTSRTFKEESVKVTNLSNNGFTLYWETDKPTITKAKVSMRDFDRQWDWQYDDRDNPQNPQKRTIHHVTFTELASKEDYIVEVANTTLPVNFGQDFYSTEVKIEEPRETTAGIPDRVYGYVVDPEGVKVEGSVVFITIDEENYLSAVTGENGSYSFDISSLNPPAGGFLEKITVVAEDYSVTEFAAQSSMDRPVPDIELAGYEIGQEGAGDSTEAGGWLKMLVGDVMATNSCFTGSEVGGVRAQCDTNIHWMKKLNVNNCPSPSRFRVGLVAHTYQTFLYEPDNIKLRLVNEDTGEVALDNIKNGEYVIKDRQELNYGEKGSSFKVEAYNSSGTTCGNADGETIVEFASKTTTYAPASRGSSPGGGSPSPGSGRSTGTPGTMPPVSPRTQSCKKYGENFATLSPVSADMYSQAADLGMNWGESIVVSIEGVHAWGQNVVNATSQGITPILRICYKGACDIEDGEEYGRAVAKMYNGLLDSGKLPSEGIYVHAGHNEPNAAEYRSPREEGEFVAGMIREVKAAGVPISHNPNDSGIKLIGPNLDLFNKVTGQGPEGPIYTASDYLDEMVQHCGGVSSNLYAMAVNDYYITHDGTNFRDVYSDVTGFIGYLKSKSSLPNQVFITEIGKAKDEGGKLVYTDAMTWTQFGEELAKLDGVANVRGILLFDSLGMNRDKNFEYHKPLWDDASIIQNEILAGCSLSSVRNPQEGNVVPPGGTPSQPGGPIPVSPVEPTDGLYCGDFNCTFVQWNGINEIYLPVGWHAWWDEGSTTGSDGASYCGDFPNNGEHFNCGRPEYGSMSKSMFANRAIEGDSLKYFTTYRTHNAGVFTSVRIGSPGVSKRVEFKAKALSWTAPDDNWYHGQVGIHPDGGVDRENVEWGEYKQLADIDPEDQAKWTQLEASVTTTSDVVTLFIRGNNQYALQNNDSYWENAELYVDGQRLVAKSYEGGSGGAGDSATIAQADLDNTNGESVLGEQYNPSYPGLPSGEMEEPGKYRIRSSKHHILLPYISTFEDEDTQISFFYDRNMNLKKDSNEPYVLDMGTIDVERVSDAVKYDLQKGFNFVSFPMDMNGENKASDFLGKIKSNGGYASSISSYYSGYWISYNDISGYGYGEDFDLLPGRGYVVKVDHPTTLVFDGSKFSESIPFDLIEGWNLVGVHGSDKDHTAKSLLQLIYDNEGITSDNLTTWFSDTQRYNGFHYDPEAKKYFGDDYDLKDNKSYFIRVLDGEGTVLP